MLNILKSIFCLAVFLWSSDKDCIYLVQSMATNVKLNFCLEKVIFLKILRRKATVTEMILLKQISLALAWVWSKYHLAIAEAEFKVKIGNIKFGLMVTMNSFRNYVWNNSSKLWKMVRDRKAWRAADHGVTKSWTRLGNWTTITTI